MSLRINTNVDALNAYRNLSTTQNSMSTSLERLSSGLRINKAADDAAGLAISQGLQSQIGGIGVAIRNAQDGINVVQTADGALTEVQSMLQRMNDLAVQYNNGTQNADSKTALQSEFSALQTEIGRIQDNTTFNGVALFGGSATTDFQVGYKTSDKISVDLSQKVDASTLDITAATNSDDVQALITSSSAVRANLGAIQNRMQHTINNLNVEQQNLQASNSAITDTDMASEMTNFTRAQVLSQAGTAMLAQANQASQSVLKLLQ